MSNENNVASEIAKELAKDIYEDAGHEIIEPTGKLVGLVPRAIRAALAPMEKWILQREHNIAETEKLLAMKLENVEPEKIAPPEPYVAVPALQAISYCMDNEELREMYANLLANSMTDVVRNGVHPGFVEIIKQLCPDEAKILRYFSQTQAVPTIGIRCENEKGSGIDIVHIFSNIGEQADCENPFKIEQYFNNLIRLGLLERAANGAALTNKERYDPCKNHPHIQAIKEIYEGKYEAFPKVVFTESFVYLTALGKAFSDICLSK